MMIWATDCAAQTIPPPPANALILFGARWCAPCTVELRGIAQLDAALADLPAPARPRLVLAWIDQPAAPPARFAQMRSRVMLAPPLWAAAWAEAHYATAHGLPFAVLEDSAGRACAIHPGPLTGPDVAQMWAQCRP